MDQWIEKAITNGIALTFLVALCVFLLKQVWPMFKQRMEDGDKERQENVKRLEDQARMFADTIRARDILAAESHREQIKALEALTNEIRKGGARAAKKK